MDGGSPAKASHRQHHPLRLARCVARALDGRPPCGAEAVRRPATARERIRLPGAGGHRLPAVPVGADPGRRRTYRPCRGWPRRRPRRPPAAGHAVPGQCTAPSPCWRSTTGRARRAGPLVPPTEAHPTQREVVAPLAAAAPARLSGGTHSEAADALAALVGRVGGWAGRTPSARSSRRPGSRRCCGPTG